jgi:hypothetical protein
MDAMATMGKEAREAILKNVLARTVTKAKGKFCKFDCKIGGPIIVGRLVDGTCYFWIEGDTSTYEIKGKRFFNVSGGEIRKGENGVAPVKEEIETSSPNEEKENDTMKKGKKDVKKPESKTTVIPKGGAMVTQLDYNGEKEHLPAALYTNKITCKCGNVRYVKNSDLFQVKQCKPCVKAGRLKKIGELKKTKGNKKTNGK